MRTDTERLDWLERVDAMVVHKPKDMYDPWRVTWRGQVSAGDTLRKAIDNAMNREKAGGGASQCSC